MREGSSHGAAAQVELEVLQLGVDVGPDLAARAATSLLLHKHPDIGDLGARTRIDLLYLCTDVHHAGDVDVAFRKNPPDVSVYIMTRRRMAGHMKART
jgi:hypothetical protein